MSGKMASSPFICVIIFGQFFATTSGLDVFNYTMCKAQHFRADSFVCTCTDNYCDGFSAEGLSLPSDRYAVYTSSKDGARFELNVGNISSKPEVSEDTVVLELNSSKKFQEVLGFGGAFTGIGGDMMVVMSVMIMMTMMMMINKIMMMIMTIVKFITNMQFFNEHII